MAEAASARPGEATSVWTAFSYANESKPTLPGSSFCKYGTEGKSWFITKYFNNFGLQASVNS